MAEIGEVFSIKQNTKTDESAQFTYADRNDGLVRRALIRAIESLTGQPTLRRLYLEYRAAPLPGENFWTAAIRKLQLRVEIDRGKLELIPGAGACIVVCNHPFGVIDGIVACKLVGERRPDFRILTNSLLYRAPELREWLLPIDFADTEEARRKNVASRNSARKWLADGGTLIVFPGGTVSTVPRPLATTAIDPAWQPFVAALALKAAAPVVPLYFKGQNSRLFQLASHVSQTLRLSLLFKEVADKIGTTVTVRLAEPIDPATLAAHGDRKKAADFLRSATYRLGDMPPLSPSPKLQRIAGHRTRQTARRPLHDAAKTR